jgi:hypothetical protein
LFILIYDGTSDSARLLKKFSSKAARSVAAEAYWKVR